MLHAASKFYLCSCGLQKSPPGVCGLSTVRAIRSDYWPNSVLACENNRSPADCPSESQCKQERKLQNVSEKCFLPAMRDRTCRASRAARLKTGLIPGHWLFSLRSSSKRSPRPPPAITSTVDTRRSGKRRINTHAPSLGLERKLWPAVW